MDENMGFCRFCGQAVYDAADDESAALKCDCPKSKEYQRQNDTYEKTIEQIRDVTAPEENK